MLRAARFRVRKTRDSIAIDSERLDSKLKEVEAIANTENNLFKFVDSVVSNYPAMRRLLSWLAKTISLAM